MNNRVPILTYHSIDDSGSVISITADKFREHMDVLKKRRYDVITLKNLVSLLREHRRLSDRTAVITFDDGYKNFGSAAFPILKNYGFTATVFLIASYCGLNNQWEGQSKKIPDYGLLDWDDIRMMANQGMEFGAHTMTHANLVDLSKEQVLQEVKNSQAAIQKHLKESVLFFAYPYGHYTEEIKHLIKEYFYGACSTKLSLVSPGSDIYALPRIDMYYFSRNNLFRWLGTPYFSRYIKFRNMLRIFKEKTSYKIPKAVR